MLLGAIDERQALRKIELGEVLEEIVEVDAVGLGERLEAGNSAEKDIEGLDFPRSKTPGVEQRGDREIVRLLPEFLAGIHESA